MEYLLILLPLGMAGVAFAIPSNRVRPWSLPLGGLAHLALVGYAAFAPGSVSRRRTCISGWV
jgi:hypothetical protein